MRLVVIDPLTGQNVARGCFRVEELRAVWRKYLARTASGALFPTAAD
jgi:hypothetical protein